MTTLDRLVLAAAARRPSAIAVRQGSRQLTYAELVGRAAAHARQLQMRGAGPEVRVGVRVGRHPGLPVALLGVLMSGAAYVPLDPSQPGRRLDELASEVDFVIDDVPEGVAEPPGHRALPGNAAYVIYTSGSTGRPKGVVVSHDAVCSFVEASIAHTGAGESTRALAFAAIGFDVSVLELFVPLAAGGCVALAPETARADAVVLQRFCEEHEITWASIPPVLLPLLDPARLPWLRTLMTGDEPPGPEQVARWTAPGRRFLNCYGSTETTVQVSAFEAGTSQSGPIPIGRPLAGHRFHVVDEDLRLTQDVGELLVGGPGLARGYLARPGLTAAAFVPDPFSDMPGERLYRTGDLVSWGSDGELRFHGRRDRQLKIRGQRVEPGELEAVLCSHPRVVHAVVDVTGGGLHAYVRSDVDTSELRDWCAERLPAALVPGRITSVDSFPLRSSGKVDLSALKDDAIGKYWCAALPEAAGAPDEDFFAEGGHSLAAMQIVASIRSGLGRDVTVSDVYGGRSLQGLRERVSRAATLGQAAPISGHPARLTAAQRRLWFMDQLAPGSGAYNIAMAQRITGALDLAALARSLTAVSERHDVLRWRIPQADGVPYVVVDPPRPVPVPVREVSEAELPSALKTMAESRLELAAGPLWRAELLRLGPQEHVLAITAHHAIFDGWSEDVLYRELSGVAAPLEAQFGDYAAWRESRESTLPWWISHLSGAPAVLRLPIDRPRPPVQTYGGALVKAAVPPETTAAVEKLAGELGVTTATVYLAAYARLVGVLSDQDTVLIGAPVADRRLAEFASLIGFFVDIVPLRIELKHGAFADLVAACGEEMVSALANPAAALEDIVDGLGLPRDPSRHPLVQTLFNVFNFAPPRLRLDGLTIAPEPAGLPGSPFDLTAYLLEDEGGTAIELVYNPDLFGASRISELLATYLRLLASPDHPIVARPGVRQSDPIPAQRTARQSAVTTTEETVTEIWRELLGHNDFGVTDNFFDAGGRSMTLVRMQARIDALLHRQVSVVELFGLPTIRALSAHLDGAAEANGQDPVLARAAARAQLRRQAGRNRVEGR